ncbi:hypothetical protein GXP67_31740 [Rhodocytophaga rosea]|uniref:Uncharacterized protein n=1 Tax=Rhodocytophaga rosea TaxID=2704465 RepID=A0A6C0GS56_9BACT|nr:hypothetical protein [Rhodocytophaga rosea]QHT70896.1 hypothetical protein GXP67_31740 [Rhodocytophaga rosea]
MGESYMGKLGNEKGKLLTQIVHSLTHLDHFGGNLLFFTAQPGEDSFLPAVL